MALDAAPVRGYTQGEQTCTGASKGSDKRMATLIIFMHGDTGLDGLPPLQQPPIAIVFRGQGLRLSAEERAAWHPGVDVYFQKKGWCDGETCCAHLARTVKTYMTQHVPSRDTILFLDNLKQQKTRRYRVFFLLNTYLKPGSTLRISGAKILKRHGSSFFCQPPARSTAPGGLST